MAENSEARRVKKLANSKLSSVTNEEVKFIAKT